MIAPPALLALEQICKRFGAIVVAERIDLRLREGEALGIIGPNGAGKTTLFGIISGTIAPDSGRVVYAGRDITALPPAQRCALGIGRSFQIPQPFSGLSVFENLVVAAAFGAGRRERDAYENCMAILQRCGLADKANRPADWLCRQDHSAQGSPCSFHKRRARAGRRRMPPRRRDFRTRSGRKTAAEFETNGRCRARNAAPAAGR